MSGSMLKPIYFSSSQEKFKWEMENIVEKLMDQKVEQLQNT